MSAAPGWDGTRFGVPQAGAEAELSKTVTVEDLELFAQITGDRNPLHFDPAAAEASRFGGLIAQGGVTSGLLNAVVAEQLPGPGTVFLEVAWKFTRPTYVGERITATVRVVEARPDKPICKLETEVRTAAGDVCLTGTATTYTVALPPA